MISHSSQTETFKWEWAAHENNNYILYLIKDLIKKYHGRHDFSIFFSFFFCFFLKASAEFDIFISPPQHYGEGNRLRLRLGYAWNLVVVGETRKARLAPCMYFQIKILKKQFYYNSSNYSLV